MATEQQVREFINKVAPLVQKYAKEYGYKVASPIIAQACLESGYGLSSLSSVYNNHFGMKCGSAWQGKSVNMATKEEYQAGVITNIRDNFRVYDTFEAGVKGYFEFISTNRYANLKNANSAETYLASIKADGYATSNSYVANNMAIVLKYNLTKYDNLEEATPAPAPVPAPAQSGDSYTVQKGDTLSGIARKYGTSVQALASLNGIADPNKIRAGQVLKVKGQPAPQPTTQNTYTVQSGDTLSGIAKKYGTTVNTLASINGIIDPNRIVVGQVLKLTGNTEQTYTVKSGDTLSKIAKRELGDAKRYPEIATLNGIKDPNKISVGQVLKLPN